MKYILFSSFIVGWWYGSIMQSTEPSSTIPVIKDFDSFNSVTVWAETQNGKRAEWIQNGQAVQAAQVRRKGNIKYFPEQGEVTIHVALDPIFSPSSEDKLIVNSQDLKDKEIHLGPPAHNNRWYSINLRPVGYQRAKKQKIKAYKPNSEDQKTDWTVQITDKNGTEIAQSTFKKDTDGFAKKLYVRLNNKLILNDKDSETAYDYNIIKVFDTKMTPGAQPLYTFQIDATQVKPGSQIKVTRDRGSIVDSKNQEVAARR